MTKEYQAVLLTAPKQLTLGKLPLPPVGPGEALVRIRCANLCPTDIKIVHHLDDASAKLLLAQGPLVLGHEASGVVEEVGKDVEGFPPGTRVAIAPVIPCGECVYCREGDFPVCLNLKGIGYSAGSMQDALDMLNTRGIGGCFAEYIKVPASLLLPIPDSLSFEAAALMEPLADVLFSIEAGNPQPNETAVVFGLGAMGLMHVRVLSSLGVKQIIAVDPLAARRNIAAAFGATLTLDSAKDDAVAEIKKATGGVGAHLHFICAGGNAQKICAGQALQAVRKKGRVMLYASALKPAELPVDINNIHYGLNVLSGTVGYYPRHGQQALQLLAGGVVDAGKVRTPVYPLARFQEAFDIYGSPEVVKVGLDMP